MWRYTWISALNEANFSLLQNWHETVRFQFQPTALPTKKYKHILASIYIKCRKPGYMKLYGNQPINMQIQIVESLTQDFREMSEKQGLCW